MEQVYLLAKRRYAVLAVDGDRALQRLSKASAVLTWLDEIRRHEGTVLSRRQ